MQALLLCNKAYREPLQTKPSEYRALLRAKRLAHNRRPHLNGPPSARLPQRRSASTLHRTKEELRVTARRLRRRCSTSRTLRWQTGVVEQAGGGKRFFPQRVE
ncbi:hypothetical protein AAFF_G00124250 [Aldrovandia affinis]|uniref:Uncharacterized protein n=1 Tax=Aldrovandia affinis TaxID=143900 RepID=A0AAD7RRX5_9TELE|nr:hypothetical protein AAFF_G00124250 [Aldrovandia affinis]